MYIRSVQFNNGFNHDDVEILIEAIDQFNAYYIKTHQHFCSQKFIKWLLYDAKEICEIDEQHWVYPILKEHVYKIEKLYNPLLVPLGEYKYKNSYEDLELLKKNNPLKYKQQVNITPIIKRRKIIL